MPRLRVGNLLWGNDLPHPEGTYPHTRRWITERFRDVPTDETARILGANAAEVYRLDTAAPADVVDRIGPTHDEPTTPSTVEELTCRICRGVHGIVGPQPGQLVVGAAPPELTAHRSTAPVPRPCDPSRGRRLWRIEPAFTRGDAAHAP